MRTKTIAANWKANASLRDSKLLIDEILLGSWSEDRRVIIAAPYVYLNVLQRWLSNSSISLAAQDCSSFTNGAYTGEVSAQMLKDIGVDYVIIGHSERRSYFHEAAKILSQKIERASEKGLKIIYCVGESLEQRKSNEHKTVVADQLSVLSEFPQLSSDDLTIAYEPVWAIGTGETASPEQAEEMHQSIREELESLKGEGFAQSVCLLYGGSVKPGNAKELFQMPNIDGGLVGGASLKAQDFLEIIRS